MKIIVNSDRSIQKEYEGSEINDGSQNENRVTTITFEVPEDYSSFAKRIVFITKDGNYFDEIVNDEYVLKNNVTKYKKLLAFVWLVNSTTHQDFRSEAFPLEFNYNENFTGAVPSEEELSEIELLFEQLEALIAEVESIDNLTYEIVEELPTEDIDPHVIYMILKEESEPNNVYNEWMYINEEWELIGTTAIDLQPLQKEIDEINEMLFTHTTAESVNQEVSLNGNPNLEMNVTELDGRVEQDSTTGKNKFAGGDSVTTSNVTFTKNSNGTYDIVSDGTATADASCDNFTDTSMFSNGQYTLSRNNTNINIQIELFNNSTWVRSLISLSTSNTNTSTTSNLDFSGGNRLRFRLRVASGTSINISGLEVQLESGSSATSFEKYTGGQASPNPDYKQDIHVVTGTQDVVVSGKNLLNIANFEEGYSLDGNGLPAVYTTTERLTNTTPIDVSGLEKVTLSYSNFGSTNRFIYSLLKADNTLITRTANNLSGTTITIGEAKYLYISFYDEATLESVTDAMLVEGDTGATYEPYITPITKQVHLGDIELAKIGTYKDKIYPSGGKWYLHKEVGKVVYDGSGDENWYINGSVHYISITDKIKQNLLVFSNMYKYSSSSWQQINNNEITSQDGNSYIFIKDNAYDSIEDYNTFLATHNVIVFYPLATATDTEITDATLIADLNAIQKLQQLNGKTIVSIEGNLSADFKLVYENDSISDLNTRVGNIESNYVKKTDYATDNTAGVIITNSARGFSLGSSHQALASVFTNEQYASKDNYTFIGKGTLENVLTARIGDINSLLDEINRRNNLRR